jgi:arabinose-5-phosphate isomerase
MLNSIEVAKEVIRIEIEGLAYMESRIGPEFDIAVKAILNTQGRTIICGMGKSGLIGKKIAASFASTGTPSFFMHPGEAFHGDLGMVKPEDIFIAVSYSGETDEVLRLIPFLHSNSNFVIAITGNEKSTLALNSNCHLDIAVPKEACLLRLAPTSSTTAALVMGDALTVALMKDRDFKPENFARFHPGGRLGRKLLSKVRDVMVSEDLPFITSNYEFIDLVHAISSGQCGAVIVKHEEAIGIITDGDLRRYIEINKSKAFAATAKDLVNLKPKLISADASIEHAYDFMEQHKVNLLLVGTPHKIIGLLKK